MKIKHLFLGFILTAILLTSCGKTRQEKIDFIIEEQNYIEFFKTTFKYRIDKIKSLAVGEDSLKIIEIEKQLTDDIINQRMTEVYNQFLNDKELDQLYDFFKSDMYKIFKSNEFSSSMNQLFSDVNDMLNTIEQNIVKPE